VQREKGRFYRDASVKMDSRFFHCKQCNQEDSRELEVLLSGRAFAWHVCVRPKTKKMIVDQHLKYPRKKS
jgi:hypothetical protein